MDAYLIRPGKTQGVKRNKESASSDDDSHSNSGSNSDDNDNHRNDNNNDASATHEIYDVTTRDDKAYKTADGVLDFWFTGQLISRHYNWMWKLSTQIYNNDFSTFATAFGFTRSAIGLITSEMSNQMYQIIRPVFNVSIPGLSGMGSVALGAALYQLDPVSMYNPYEPRPDTRMIRYHTVEKARAKASGKYYNAWD